MNRKERRIAEAQQGKAQKPGLLQQAAMLHQAGRLDAAEVLYQQVIAADPQQADALTLLSAIALDRHEHEKALQFADEALEANPRHRQALANRSAALAYLHRHGELLSNYEREIAVNSFDNTPQYRKALIMLTLGDYAQGWRQYERRWQQPDIKMSASSDKPLWLGQESLAGKTIFLHGEQGQGDTIQFCRYVPLVEALGAKVVLGVPSALASVISTLKGSYTLLGQGGHAVQHDYHCPLMSLPLALGTTLETIPADIPYLYADETKQRGWREKLGANTKPRIGLVWAGGTAHKNDAHRSLPLAAFTPLLQCNVEFHALQKDLRAGDAETLKNSGITWHADELVDYTDTAALIAELDMVITVDTSVAHLAGAMGKQVWIFIPFVPDFRWLLTREDSPWYPTARLFRQSAVGKWEDVIIRMTEAVKAITA